MAWSTLLLTWMLLVTSLGLKLSAASEMFPANNGSPTGRLQTQAAHPRDRNLRAIPDTVFPDEIALGVIFPDMPQGPPSKPPTATVGQLVMAPGAQPPGIQIREPTFIPKDPIDLPDSLDELPDEQLNILNKITSIDDFIATFGLVVPSSSNRRSNTSNTRASGGSSSSSINGYLTYEGEWAGCKVKKQTVEVDGPLNVPFFWPSKVWLDRCSGACFGNGYICTPMTTRIVNIEVLGIDSRNTNGRRTANYYIVQHVEHATCGCLKLT